ncbi:hypothetical protein LCGC14_1302620 [marine sediment metagenome]|uniref:Uncharacterized protein n=1 Tax=marine sediment metagenome TaxID=412755 RepID=A0A0F9KPJ5_9ZZZZ
MRKPSKKRLALLNLINDYGTKERNGWVYFPSFSPLQLERYGLSVYDKATITCTEKANLIETKWGGMSGRLTELGADLIKKKPGPSDRALL